MIMVNRRYLRRMIRVSFIIFHVFFCVACYNRGPITPDAWDLTKQQLDSISFYTTHHYTQNFNFLIKADSLRLIVQHPTEVVNGLPVDTFSLYKIKLL